MNVSITIDGARVRNIRGIGSALHARDVLNDDRINELLQGREVTHVFGQDGFIFVRTKKKVT